MSIESMDFQAIVHQHVTTLLPGWKNYGMTEEQMQECASQLFNMGLIASQQVQQEGGIQPQGTDQKLPYTPPMAERVIGLFIQGMNAAIVKSHEERYPSAEKWQFMQNVAYHVFEQAKQAVIATLGQESTPEVQISDEQIYNWLGQTAVEALQYYATEHEKQHGPLNRLEPEGGQMPPMEEESLPPEAPFEEEDFSDDPETSLDDEPVYEEPQPQHPVQQAPQPAPANISQEDHHKYAAVGLLLSSLPNSRHPRILSAFRPDEQQIINAYRDPDNIAQNLDLEKVAHYLKIFKDKMGQGKGLRKSQYASDMSKIITALPSHRLERLFHDERPFVRGYVNQFMQPSDRDLDPYTLPPGVEESLMLYLHRNFPQEVEAL